jgi:hypothetical protein
MSYVLQTESNTGQLMFFKSKPMMYLDLWTDDITLARKFNTMQEAVDFFKRKGIHLADVVEYKASPEVAYDRAMRGIG